MIRSAKAISYGAITNDIVHTEYATAIGIEEVGYGVTIENFNPIDNSVILDDAKILPAKDYTVVSGVGSGKLRNLHTYVPPPENYPPFCSNLQISKDFINRFQAIFTGYFQGNCQV